MTDEPNAKSNALSRVENHWLALQASAVAKRGLDLLPTLPPRTLHFPTERSIGWLYIHAPGEYGLHIREQAQPAQGDVAIPAGKQVGLAVTQTDLAPLRALRANDLDLLSLAEQAIADTQLANIAHLHLRRLILEHTPLSDAGLAHLKTVNDLQTLRVANTRVGDAGLSHLQSLPNLVTLDLSNTLVTNAGLACLSAWSSLQVLLLAGTFVTDAGLVHLKPLTHLTALDLSRTAISDAGLDALQPLALLEDLGLADTSITAAGWERLRHTLPRCTIVR
jgi:hypothetical protein